MKSVRALLCEYTKKTTWEELVALKLSACAAGVLLGVAVPRRLRVPAAKTAALLCVAAGVPLVLKFMDVAFDRGAQAQ